MRAGGGVKGRRKEGGREGKRGRYTRFFKLSHSTPSDILPLARPHLLSLPKPLLQLGDQIFKCPRLCKASVIQTVTEVTDSSVGLLLCLYSTQVLGIQLGCSGLGSSAFTRWAPHLPSSGSCSRLCVSVLVPWPCILTL